MRCASPPERVDESRSRVRYSRPTSLRNFSRCSISTRILPAIPVSSGVSSRTAIVTVSGSGVSSQSVSITQSGTTGIESDEISKSVKVYPNPVTDELIIEYVGNKEKTDFQILNTISQIVFSGSMVDRTVVETNNLTPGVYLVKIKSGDTFGFKKMIKK